MVLSAAVEASSGQETRTISTPASSQRRIWPIVALASEVSVLVMVWTLIGASPPISSFPIRIVRLLRRSIMRQGRTERGSWARSGMMADMAGSDNARRVSMSS